MTSEKYTLERLNKPHAQHTIFYDLNAILLELVIEGYGLLGVAKHYKGENKGKLYFGVVVLGTDDRLFVDWNEKTRRFEEVPME